MITNIPDTTHLTLATAVATTAGQKVANGALVSAVCGNANPTPYPEWPDPATGNAVLKLAPGGGARGALTLGAGGAAHRDADRHSTAAASDTTLMNEPARRTACSTSPTR